MSLTEPAVTNNVDIIDLTGLSDSSESDDNQDEVDEANEAGSEDSEIEITLNANTRALLKTAIDTVSEMQLRQILKQLVDSEVTVEALLTRELVTVKRGTTHDIVPRWEKCANCGGEFDINMRESNECIFHPGDVEEDEDQFPDHDEDCHGPMDTSENRKQFPEKFIWTCCDANLLSVGCVRDQHKAITSRKRKRVDE